MSRRAATPREVDLQVNALTHEGLGVAELDTRQVQVRNALPGETVRARILKRRRGVLFADALEVSTANRHRRAPACGFFPRCGGCSLHHLSHARQLQLKQQHLAEELQKHEVRVHGWAPPRSRGRLGYRRKARLGVRLVGERVLVGFRESFSNRVARLSHCEVLTPQLSRLVQPLQETISSLSIAAQVPQIEFAQGDHQAVLMVRHLAPMSAGDLALWRTFQQQQQAQVLLQPGGYDSLHTLDGGAPGWLNYLLPAHGLDLRFKPHQFTQVNLPMNQLLVADALAYLGNINGCRVADLFCGIGNFSLPLARAGALVQGFEASTDAVASANYNAQRNGMVNSVQFAAADLYGEQWELPGGLQALLLDPPRSGAGPNLEAWMQRFEGGKIVYVSCNPASFARDAQLLQRSGFALRRAGIYDMFPHTAHVETMGYFERSI